VSKLTLSAAAIALLGGTSTAGLAATGDASADVAILNVALVLEYEAIALKSDVSDSRPLSRGLSILMH